MREQMIGRGIRLTTTAGLALGLTLGLAACDLPNSDGLAPASLMSPAAGVSDTGAVLAAHPRVHADFCECLCFFSF